MTRKALLDKLEKAGFPESDLLIIQQLVDMQKSDLFDVLEYVFNANYQSMTREQRVAVSETTIFALLNKNQREFIQFVLNQYIKIGVEELDQEKLPILLINKYKSLSEAEDALGDVESIKNLFIDFQKHLYEKRIA